jgi:hypothetical protein
VAHAQRGNRPAPAENAASSPPSLSAPALSTNYRLALIAQSGDKSVGEISVLTCSSAIETSGYLIKPADQLMPATTLSLRGTLTEAEKGSLLFVYSFIVVTPVVSQSLMSMASAAQRSGSDSKRSDAKAGDETKPAPLGNVTMTFNYRDHASTGALRVKAGSTYELVSMGGITYSLKISAEPEK